MDRNTFETADKFLDEAAEMVEEALKSDHLDRLRSILKDMNKAIGSRYGVGLVVNVEVFDRERERNLPLLRTGLAGFDAEEPYVAWGDSSSEKYVAESDIQVVPHDHCPKCWESWDFKFKNRSCGHCGATMGKDLKLLLDTDRCPFCNEGTVTASTPTCAKCGYAVDPRDIVWG